MAAAGPADAAGALRRTRTWRGVKNGIATALMALALVAVAIPLALVVYAVVRRGADVISWQFLTAHVPQQRAAPGKGGMGPAVAGTILITLVATLMAVPLGILGAVYLNEYGKAGRLAAAIRFLSYVMTGVPSIVMGLFVFTIWVVSFGYSGFAGALALACLMLPIVIRSTEEMLRLVPDHLREASQALGARQSRTILTVVLPAALPGITSGCLLAVARAAGETAPLVFTILTVFETNADVFNGPNTSLATQIFVNAQSPFVGAQARAWGAALTLVALAFLLTVSARLITRRLALARG